ncbi:hypothetical protein Tco_1281812 [Tanacetum coccineum]
MGKAIGRAINKGMQDGLAAGIEHGVTGRSITDVAAYNPSSESDYVAVVNALQSRLRGDATARRLSLTDSIRPLVEPLSSRVLTGEASSSADVTVTTALATTFSQTFPIPARPSTKVPLSPKIVFEEEELDTTPEHALAP